VIDNDTFSVPRGGKIVLLVEDPPTGRFGLLQAAQAKPRSGSIIKSPIAATTTPNLIGCLRARSSGRAR
jgi:hypothetical protein